MKREILQEAKANEHERRRFVLNGGGSKNLDTGGSPEKSRSCGGEEAREWKRQERGNRMNGGPWFERGGMSETPIKRDSTQSNLRTK